LHRRHPKIDNRRFTQVKLRTITTKLLLLVFGLAGSSAALAEADARAELLAFINSADRFAAGFEQTLTDETGEVIEVTGGRFWLQRPGMFRWHYAEPMERILVSDGKRIWLYDVDLDQVTVRDAEGAIESTPAGILVGDATTLDNYDLTIAEQRGSYRAVSLRPKAGGGDFSDILLGLERGALVDLRLQDRFGQLTEIRFIDTQANPEISTATFELEIPDGVDVIDQTAGD
jgi:outer membrane lipoprotein carrier protein